MRDSKAICYFISSVEEESLFMLSGLLFLPKPLDSHPYLEFCSVLVPWEKNQSLIGFLLYLLPWYSRRGKTLFLLIYCKNILRMFVKTRYLC